MSKKLTITETELRNIVREEIKNQTIFVNPSNFKDLEPIDYDYLINRNKGLPDEYFEPTNIPYDPNEVAMYTIPSEVSCQADLNEGLREKINSTKEPKDFKSTWEWIATFEGGTPEWREAINICQKYYEKYNNPEPIEYLDQIIEEHNKWKERK